MNVITGNQTNIDPILKTVAERRISRDNRRRSVEKTAMTLFAKYGYRGTTTKEIAVRAGVSEASLFQYFNSKAELYAAVLAGKTKNLSDDWLNEINRYAIKNDDEKLFQAIADKISEQFEREAEFLRLMLYSALEGHAQAKTFYERQTSSLQKFLSDYIKRRQREESFQPCDAEAAAHGFIGVHLHCAMMKMLSGADFENASAKKSIADFTRLTLDGLRSGASGRGKYTGIF